MSGPIYTEIDGQEQPLTSVYGNTVHRTEELDDPWVVTLSATIPDGQILTREVVLDKNSRQDLEDALNGHCISKRHRALR